MGGEEGLRRLLEQVPRFVGKRMVTRSSVGDHERRTSFLVEELVRLAVMYDLEVNGDLAYGVARIHDGYEAALGDVPADEKQRLLGVQRFQLRGVERVIATGLVNKFDFRVRGISYKELMDYHFEGNGTTHAVVNYADKADALGECLLELHATEGGEPHRVFERIAWDYAGNRLPKIIKNSPTLKLLAELHPRHPLFNLPTKRDIAKVAQASPYTGGTLGKETGVPFYDFWRHVALEKGDYKILTSTCAKETLESNQVAPSFTLIL